METIKILVAVVLLNIVGVSVIKANPYDEPDKSFFNQKDKQLHIGGTALISAVFADVAYHDGFSRYESAMIGWSVAMLVGVFKEMSDKHSDKDDILANTIGSSLGVIPVLFIYKF